MEDAEGGNTPAPPASKLGTVDERPSRSSKDGLKKRALHSATTQPAQHHSPVSPRIAPEEASERPSQMPILDEIDRDHYEIFGEIARGGLGRILRARDKRLDREVAIKELHYHVGNVEARFGREMRLTARLQHPSIVPIYEAGRWESGEPFYAMKLVAGRSLADVAADAQTLEERLLLLPNIVDVAEAIAYAHSEKILHRDLKPANVLVGPFGETVVIDWGLAKDLENPAPEREPQPDDQPDDVLDGSMSSFATGSGAVIGTPAFMPPEQARGEAVDERADVYALGALLYHVLSGARPYEGVHRGKLLEAVKAEAPAPLSKIAPDLPRDLAAIIERAMARDAAERYPTAKELVDDLQRFQAGKLVASHEYTLGELLRKFVERQKAAVLTALLGALALAALGVWSFVSIAEERDQAEASAAEATEARDLEAAARALAEDRIDLLRLEKASALLETDPTGAIAWLKELRAPLPGAPTIAADAADRGVARLVRRGHRDSVGTASFSPDGTLLATGSNDNAVRVWPASSSAARVLDHHSDRVVSVSFSPDGSHLASAGNDGRVCVYETEGLGAGCRQTHARRAKDLAWSPDGREVASIGSDAIIVRRLGEDEPRLRLDAELDRHGHVIFTRTRIVSGSHGGTLHVWDAATGERVGSLTGHVGEITSFDVTQDDRRAVSAGEDGTVRLWDLTTFEGRVLGMHAAEVEAVVFDPEGRRAASAGLDQKVVVWDLRGGEHVELVGHGERVDQLAFHPDGELLASGSWDRTVRLWSLADREPRVLRGHEDVISWIGFSPSGERLVSASWDGEVRTWPVAPHVGSVLGHHEIGVHTVDTSPDGRHAASGGHDDTVRLWDLESGAMRVLGRHQDHVYRVRFSPTGAWVASSSDDQTVRLFAPDSGASHVLEGHEADVEEIAFSADGQRLASAGEDDRVFLWDLTSMTGTPLIGHEQPVTAVTFSPDGSLLASASRDRSVRLWNVSDASLRARFSDHALDVWGLAFSPDGSTLASASLDDRLVLWDVETEERTLVSDELASARLVAYSPDGERIAVSSTSRHLWVCEIQSRRCEDLEGHGTTVTFLFFSPDGRALVSTSGDGTIRAWDVETTESRVYRGHRAAVFEAALTPDGLRLVSGSADMTIRLWPFGLPPKPQDLGAFLDDLTSATVSSIGQAAADVR